MKKIAFVLASVLLLGSCSAVPDLQDEMIATFEVQAATIAPDLDSGEEPSQEGQQQDSDGQQQETLEQRFSALSFTFVSGNYARNTIYQDTQYTEIFMPEKNHFVRIAASDLEEEVFAYNYISDDFTYLYYFDGELMAKVIYNVASGEIKQDDGGFAEYIVIDAEELKIYCTEILKQAGISAEEL